ncbi:unnamed protein product [Ambrosiozyma monospora]|uniref:Unnamed protein product n=1 Tax=Ambrosiozyma monospora TaxID=43982 RepID=A0ACB5U0K5_AMBMO|nr:unnamed protein product [Ambrosiozyma monospora]
MILSNKKANTPLLLLPTPIVTTLPLLFLAQLVVPLLPASSAAYSARGSSAAAADNFSDDYITITDIYTTDLTATVTVSCSSCANSDSTASLVSANKAVTNVLTVPVSDIPSSAIASAGSTGTVTITTTHSVMHAITVTLPCEGGFTTSVASVGKLITETVAIPVTGVPSVAGHAVAATSLASSGYSAAAASAASARGSSAAADIFSNEYITLTTVFTEDVTGTVTVSCSSCADTSSTESLVSANKAISQVLTVPVSAIPSSAISAAGTDVGNPNS